MWEFAIYMNSSEREIAKQLYQKMQSFSNTYDTIVSFYEKDCIVGVVTSCSDIEKFRYISFVEELIIETICNSYKKQYLLSNLGFNGFDEITNEAFIQALIFFDRETDRYIVSKYLQLEKQINLDGFFNFKLKTLKDKWSELVGIANENQVYLYSNDTFVELIKFLIDNIEVKSDVINIIKQNEEYKILDAQFEEIAFEEKLLENDKSLISSIISLCPKNINIYCSDILPNNVTKLICTLFEKRVKFLTKVNWFFTYLHIDILLNLWYLRL